ncbi:ABC transporter substrate-binding protein [Paenibacillus baekrokdamisoli]|uniref:ABC transporter substrate-binding protein n=1 Tax=Paenibacillus baekrokdamisoli TaxID=1712516 RepID=A0A3G9JG83_9BACL|nr:extracellular solute-binding protein [Paenibacillus baekrokdamisoli]MBB3070897.1 ABC-type glycerol-3-phosphate transport system substrate-binding protein [Paenibacillus baekrokdamisoli]BBH22164.1 ABC transporter substrate-binding protein [Paenibacillus baekrokdamisoli]
MNRKAIRLPMRLVIFLLICTAIVLFYAIRSFWFEQKHYEPADVAILNLPDADQSAIPTYNQKLQQYDSQGVPNTTNVRIELNANNLSQRSNEGSIEKVHHDVLGKEVLQWKNAEGWIEWEADIKQEGLYEIQIQYSPLKGTSSSIMRGLLVDGVTPFQESARIELDRIWKDAQYPYAKNAIGNEIRSKQVEVEGWYVKTVSNFETDSRPMRYHLMKGRHLIRMTGVREPVAIGSLIIKSPDSIPAYASYVTTHTEQKNELEWYSLIEAEQFTQKSNIGIQKYSVSEANISPDPKGRLVYNTLGADRWKFPGHWVEWGVKVPEDGWYAIDVKYRQSYQGRTTVYRTITIDDRVPFEEMLSYPFAYSRSFSLETLKDRGGNPYLFYLERGSHTLRMTADSSPVRPALQALYVTLDHLREFDRQIRTVIGDYSQFQAANSDVNRTWDLKRNIPNIEQQVTSSVVEMENIVRYMNGLNGSETDLTAAIEQSIITLREFLHDVDKIPNRLTELTAIQSKIGTWLTSVDQQPLLLDYIVVRTPETKTGLRISRKFEKFSYSIGDFFRSFYLAYNSKSEDKEKTIDVWMNRGRDYVDLLQDLIDQDFTPNTGIKVNLNLIPNPNVLVLGNAAGEQPDVALGIAMDTPVEFAMRGATANLRQFPDFEKVVTRFHPGVMRSYTLDNGIYGLPEVENFPVFFYRTDLFEQLKLKPPDTWDDLYDILPTLQENFMTFYYPPKDFTPFFYQRGLDFYSADGMNTTLRKEEAIKPFKQWMDLFEKYYLPLEVPSFFNHFRYGDIPAGIADFNTYVLLSVAAPDIAGHWKIAPLPGMKQSDGTVARWSPQATTSMLMMEKSSKKEEAWQFMKWWSSTETQLRYGQDIESYFGLEYRWNSANMEALLQSPWPSDDLKAIAEQARWVKNVPVVPGYYFLSREMDFAWNHVLLDGMAEKEALDRAAVSIEREMRRKQSEFGYDSDRNLNIPQMDKPYDLYRRSEHD